MTFTLIVHGIYTMYRVCEFSVHRADCERATQPYSSGGGGTIYPGSRSVSCVGRRVNTFYSYSEVCIYCPVVKTEQLGMTNCSCYDKYTHRGKGKGELKFGVERRDPSRKRCLYTGVMERMGE